MSKKRKKSHKTTKNTMRKPPVTRFRVIRVEMSNGVFDLVTNFHTEEDFNKLLMEWYDSPSTKIWNSTSLISFIKMKQPDRFCMLQEDFDKDVYPKIIPATKEEWEAENN